MVITTCLEMTVFLVHSWENNWPVHPKGHSVSVICSSKNSILWKTWLLPSQLRRQYRYLPSRPWCVSVRRSALRILSISLCGILQWCLLGGMQFIITASSGNFFTENTLLPLWTREREEPRVHQHVWIPLLWFMLREEYCHLPLFGTIIENIKSVKRQTLEWVLGAMVKSPYGSPVSWFGFWIFSLSSSFPLRLTMGGESDGSSSWVPASHVGDLTWVLGSRLWCGPVLAVVNIWAVTQKMKDGRSFLLSKRMKIKFQTDIMR